MNRPAPQLAVTGSAMDTVVPKRSKKRIVIASAATAAALVAAVLIWRAMPHGLQVGLHDVRIASVEKGVFEDNIMVRANTAPLHSVILDSIESGRVEEVNVRDGVLVKKGEQLFRLSNSQRNIELLARQAELAQQISNLSNLRVTQEASRTDHQRRLSDLQYSLQQAEKTHARNIRLSEQGFISMVALDESKDQLAQKQRDVRDEVASIRNDTTVRNDAVVQMAAAIKGLQSGLHLVQASVEALAVRAPADGRLTGFSLQVGQTVKTDDHIGRIDDPARFKLSALVDEFYLNRVTVGRRGTVRHGARDYPVEVSAVYPQIKEGRFSVDMVFIKDAPEALSPGQSLDTQLTLGEPSPALLLPNGAFVNDSGGAWVFVVSAAGKSAERRDIKIGRRSNSQIEVLSGLGAGEKVIVSSYASFGKSLQLQLAGQ